MYLPDSGEQEDDMSRQNLVMASTLWGGHPRHARDDMAEYRS